MVPLRFTTTKIINRANNNDDFVQIVSDSLVSIGFKDVDYKKDTLFFKHDIKDSDIESFQRKYGDGEVNIDMLSNRISVTEDYRRAFRFSLVFLIILVLATFILRFFDIGNDISTSQIFLLFSALFTSMIFEYILNRNLIIGKQKKLLDMIDDYIKQHSPATNNVYSK
jgi:hypothetical protein